MTDEAKLVFGTESEAAWGIKAGGTGVLHGITGRVRLASGRLVAAGDYPEHATENTHGVVCRVHSGLSGVPDMAETLAAPDDGSGLVCTVTLTGTAGNEPVSELEVVSGALPAEAWLGAQPWTWRMGTNMPSDPFYYWRVSPEDRDAYRGLVSEENGTVSRPSESAVILKSAASDRVLLCGFVTLRRMRTRIVIDSAGDEVTLRAVCDLEHRPIDPGETVASEKLLLRTAATGNAAMDEWIEAVTREQPPRVPARTPAGWSDWNFYRKGKSEQDILDNVAALSELKKQGYPLEYVVIDDGFCEHNSDWLKPNERFPHGMAWLCEQIRKAGLKPGLWLAPYIINLNSQTAQAHPEWMMRRRASDELASHNSNVGPCHVLDLTVPEAMDWMCEVTRVMMQEWGVEWLKLDGPALRHYDDARPRDPKVTTVEMVTESLRRIREIAGDALVEGEGYYGPSIGFVDLQRVNGDNGTVWSTPGGGWNCTGKPTWNKLVFSGCLHQRFWLNHSQDIILRDAPSPHCHVRAADPQAIEHILSGEELRFQLTAHFLSGAPVLLCDPIDLLKKSPDRLRLVSRMIPNNGPAARVVDEFNGALYPFLYAMPRETPWERWTLVGALNHEDTHRDLDVDLAGLGLAEPCHAFEFWTEQYLGCVDKRLEVRDVPPHGARLVCLRRDTGRPQLLSTSMHLSQGAAEIDEVSYDDATGKLAVRIRHFVQDDERLFIHVPAGFTYTGAEGNASGLAVDDRRPECLVVRFDGAADGNTDITLRFGQK